MNSKIQPTRNLTTEIHSNNQSPLSQSPNSDLLISVIIPVYNEEKTIKNVINKIPNHRNYEIIIVDDGSTDKSIQEIKKSNKKDITILQHQNNLGYGAALITGFKKAKGDLIITLDSDGQHNPEEIETILKPIIQNKADLVIGSRYLGNCNYKLPIYTRIGEYCVKICIITLFHKRIGNNQSGYRCFRKEILGVINDNIFIGMGFTTEFLFECAHNEFRIIEIPISLDSREHGTSYVNIIEVFKSILNCIAIYYLKRYNLRINATYIKKSIKTILKLLYRIRNHR